MRPFNRHVLISRFRDRTVEQRIPDGVEGVNHVKVVDERPAVNLVVGKLGPGVLQRFQDDLVPKLVRFALPICHIAVRGQSVQRLLHRDLILLELEIPWADVVGVAGIRLAHLVDPCELFLDVFAEFSLLVRPADAHHQLEAGVEALAPGLEEAHGFLALRIGEAGVAYLIVQVDVVSLFAAGGLVGLQGGPRHVVVLRAAAQLEILGFLGNIRVGHAETREQFAQVLAALFLHRPAAFHLRLRRLLLFPLQTLAFGLLLGCFRLRRRFGVKYALIHQLGQGPFFCGLDRFRRIQELHHSLVLAQLKFGGRRQDGMGVFRVHRHSLIIS